MTMLPEVFLENRDLKWFEQDPKSVKKTLVRDVHVQKLFT